MTVKPGAYKIGPGLHRPAHIHFKVHHDGYRSLPTQLYFPGGKYNKTDPWFKPALVLDPRLEEGGKWLAATFKFVLPRV